MLSYLYVAFAALVLLIWAGVLTVVGIAAWIKDRVGR